MQKRITIVIWDVLHGLGVLIKGPNGQNMIIDLGKGVGVGKGKRKRAFSPVTYSRNRYATDSLDYLVITHPHWDHIADLDNVTLSKVKTVITSIPPDASRLLERSLSQQQHNVFKQFLNLIPTSPLPEVEKGNMGDMNFTVFRPSKPPDKNLNNQSLIVVLEYAGKKLVIPGDNEVKSLKQLMERPDFCDSIAGADILLAPHHGRNSSFYSPFVKIVAPKLTIISAGPQKKGKSVHEQYASLSSGLEVLFHANTSRQIHKQCRVLHTYTQGAIHIEAGYYLKSTFLKVTRKRHSKMTGRRSNKSINYKKN